MECSHYKASNPDDITISYGDKLKEIEKGRLEKYKVTVQTKCVVLKIKALWNSSENNLYGIDKKRAIKCIPDLKIMNMFQLIIVCWQKQKFPS
ncbi:MAG: hypothetical protein V8T65_11090 [Roseburia inulinivorans]